MATASEGQMKAASLGPFSVVNSEVHMDLRMVSKKLISQHTSSNLVNGNEIVYAVSSVGDPVSMQGSMLRFTGRLTCNGVALTAASRLAFIENWFYGCFDSATLTCGGQPLEKIDSGLFAKAMTIKNIMGRPAKALYEGVYQSEGVYLNSYADSPITGPAGVLPQVFDGIKQPLRAPTANYAAAPGITNAYTDNSLIAEDGSFEISIPLRSVFKSIDRLLPYYKMLKMEIKFTLLPSNPLKGVCLAAVPANTDTRVVADWGNNAKITFEHAYYEFEVFKLNNELIPTWESQYSGVPSIEIPTQVMQFIPEFINKDSANYNKTLNLPSSKFGDLCLVIGMMDPLHWDKLTKIDTWDSTDNAELFGAAGKTNRDNWLAKAEPNAFFLPRITKMSLIYASHAPIDISDLIPSTLREDQSPSSYQRLYANFKRCMSYFGVDPSQAMSYSDFRLKAPLLCIPLTDYIGNTTTNITQMTLSIEFDKKTNFTIPMTMALLSEKVIAYNFNTEVCMGDLKTSIKQ